MVKVIFLGVLRLDIRESTIMIEAENINDLIRILDVKYTRIDVKQIQNSIIFINGVNMNKLKRYKTNLKDGDEVIFLSPVSGG